jgi:ribonuclease P protein component
MRRGDEFFLARRKGRRRDSAHFIVYTLLRKNGPARLGLTVSRKVGGAVQRNRVKRLVREFFRNQLDCLPAGLDVSVVARPGAARLDHGEVCRELCGLLGGRRLSGNFPCSDKSSLR